MQISALIRARALTGFEMLVARHGGDAGALLAAAGLPPVLDDQDRTFLLSAVADLIALAADTLALPDFGMRLAQHQDVAVLGTIALIVRHSATLGEALAAICRYMPYHTPGARMTVTADSADPGRSLIHYDVSLLPGDARRHAMELSFCVLHNFVLLASGASGADWELDFRHLPPQPLTASDYSRYFRGAVRFGQGSDQLAIPSTLLAVPVAADNALLRESAERFVGNLLRRHPLDLAQQVQALVERQLATGGCQLPRIAAQMGVQKRTLQRRLKEQGLFFEDIVDSVRQQQAHEYLGYAALPLTEVAALLGYTEQSSFNRACKRWFGMTPQVRRDTQR